MEEDPISVQAFAALRRSACTIRSEVYKRLLARDLTLRQFMVLETLSREGPLSVGELAVETASSVEAAGRSIQRLEKRRLVARRRGSQDNYVVALTTEGGELINTLYPAHMHLVEQVMGKLTAGELDNLQQLCCRFVEEGKGP